MTSSLATTFLTRSPWRWALAFSAIALAIFTPRAAFAAFGLTTGTDFYTVDTGAGLVFKVRRTEPPNNQQTQGDIASLVYNGVEYQDQIRGSQVGIGIGGGTVSAVTDNATYVVIKVTAPDGDLTHYYVARNGYANIYMGTYFTAEPSLGNVRYIVRIPHDLLPNGPAPSDLTGTTGAIESGDVFGLPNGETRSKHYSGMRQIDWTYTGATGTNVGVWMVKGNHEGMSGGPFYRYLINQGGGDQEIYELVNYGEAQTEAYRTSILNLYTLVFTNGTTPPPIDLSWLDSLNLLGWIPASARGAVAGTATGVPAGFQAVVGFANATAQYWALPAPGGAYTCPDMIPGTYTATLYKGELAVGTGTVTVTAGTTAPLNLVSTETVPSTIFRIGEWDGTPAGFLNADKMTTMHPSDVRMSPWTPVVFNAGVDNPILFPSIQARAANSPVTIKFNLAANQITDLTLKIGITVAYNGGRPQVTVNNYTTPVINPSNQPGTRSFTVGTYRGNNTTFTFTIPASALVVGTNTMSISPISGSADLSTWLSAGWVYDAVELDGPIATPVINYVGGSPLVISGTSEPSRNITVTLDGSTVLGTATAGPNGAWSLTTAAAISAGAHAVTAVADDGAGHNSPPSAAFNFNTGVTMPSIVSAVGDTGTYANGATTSDRVFVFTGNAGAGNTVTITRVGTGTVGSVVANGSGAWSFDYTTVSLPDGANRFYATASNGAANSASSSVFTLNLAGAPRVAIERFNPTNNIISTGVSTVVFRATFNHAVSNVGIGAFQLATTGTAAGTIAGVSATTGSVFDVTVNGLSGTGNLRLDLKPNVVLGASNNPEAGYTAGQSYSLVLPTVGNGTWVRPATGGLWSDPLNWQNAVIADGTTSSANFSTLDLTADNTVQLDSPRTLNSASFGDTAPSTAASWTVGNNGNSANTLTFAGSAPTVTVGALGTGATVTLGAGLAGSSGLAKAGAGTLVLSGASTLTGTLNVNAGTLRVASGGALSLGNAAVNTATDATLNIAGGALTAGGLVSTATALVVDSGTANLGSFRTNSTFGALLRVNGGSLTIGDVNLQRTAGTAPDFNSGFIVSGGTATVTTLRVGTSNSYANVSVEGTGTLTSTGTVTLGNQTTGARGGALRVLGGAFNANDTAFGVLMCRNSGTNTANVATATFTGGVSTIEKFTLGFDATVTGGSATITINGGTVYLGGGGIVKNGAGTMTTTLSFSSGTLGAKAPWATALPITLPSAGNIAIKAADAANAPFAIALNGALSGAGGLTKTGAGTLTLGTAAHTYAGATTVNAGTLRVTSSLSSAANGVTVNSGGVLAGNGTIGRAITLNSGATIAPDGATAIASLAGTSLTWNGGATLACDLGASGTSDVVALTGALTKGSAGSYVFAFAPGAGFAVGNTYTVATFASTTFTAADFAASGLPAGTAALFTVTNSSVQVKIQGTPSITSPLTATGMYGASFSYTATATEPPVTFSASGLPAGLTINPASGVISGTAGAAGDFAVLLGATNNAGIGTATLQLTIAKAPATVSVGSPANSTIRSIYTGAPQTAAVTTVPAGLNATFTYDGSASAPTLPGTYAVVATVDDPNYAGTASGQLVVVATAFVRHGPTLTGELDGSLQLANGEAVTLNKTALVSGDLLVPGLPTVTVAPTATLAGVQDATGTATPAGYAVALNNTAMARYVVRRVDAPALPLVSAPPAPAGTRDVTLSSPASDPGDFATIRNLTVTGTAGEVTVPAGTFGAVSVTGTTNAIVLGQVGGAAPVVYNLQSLTLNGAKLKVVGPVVLVVAGNVMVNGATVAAGPGGGPIVHGDPAHPEWIALNVANGGVTLNGAVSLYGSVVAPSGTVTVNASATIRGTVASDRIALNGTGALITAP